MAVPSAVTQRMQREEAALREAGVDPNVPPAAVGSMPPPSAPAAAPAPAAPAPTEDVAALRARNAELEQEVRTQGGRTSALSSELADLKSRFEMITGNRAFLETNVTELAEKNRQLEQELADLRAKGTASQVQTVAASLDEKGPTEEQMKEYGESVPFLTSLIRRELSTVVRPLVAQMAEIEKQLARVKEIDAKIPKLEETAKITDMQNIRMREEQFLAKEVLPYFKDFETVRTTDEWKKYLSTDTGRGYPVGSLLKTYRQANNAEGIRAVIGGFYEQQKSRQTLDSLAVPGKSAADAPQAPEPVKMKASEYKANLKAFTSKRMSQADWNAYRARWDEALSKGNVEMDTELR